MSFDWKSRNSTYVDIRVTRIPRERTNRVTREQIVYGSNIFNFA